MKRFFGKSILLVLMLGLTYSCVEPEELPVEVCDPNTDSTCVVNSQQQPPPSEPISNPSAPSYQCKGGLEGVAFSTPCPEDVDYSNLTQDIPFVLVGNGQCSEAPCQQQCIFGYKVNQAGSGCEVDENATLPPTENYFCSPMSNIGTPSFATLCPGPETTGLLAETAFSLAGETEASCTDAKKCEFHCNAGYEPNSAMTTCVEKQVVTNPVVNSPETTSNGAFPIAAKNYIQINNTYSTLTNVPTSHPLISGTPDDLNTEGEDEYEPGEYQAVLMQLPSSNNPETVNGFNMIAQTRLGFAYCTIFVDREWERLGGLSNDALANSLLDGFVDIDYRPAPDGNAAHREFRAEVLAILNNQADDVGGRFIASTQDRKRKLTKMACAAILASAYVSML